MTEFVFSFLESIGFNHPIHPAITHLPMGMIMGGFLFGLTGLVLKRPEFARTAWYCAILALIGAFPTILAGYMDWQYTYEGEWINLIKIKMGLAFLLILLLAATIKINANTNRVTIAGIIFYTLCLFNAIGLGFVGGELMYG